jgi:hypothetical protein
MLISTLEDQLGTPQYRRGFSTDANRNCLRLFRANAGSDLLIAGGPAARGCFDRMATRGPSQSARRVGRVRLELAACSLVGCGRGIIVAEYA